MARRKKTNQQHDSPVRAMRVAEKRWRRWNYCARLLDLDVTKLITQVMDHACDDIIAQAAAYRKESRKEIKREAESE